MNPNETPQPATPAPKLSEFMPFRILRESVLTVVLVFMLAVVLLPLAWMILTAFKTRGTAFRLEFVPKSEVLIPSVDDKPLAVPSIKEGERWLHLETVRDGVTTVAVERKLADGKTTTHEMALTIAGLWVADIGPLDAETITYRFVVNGKDPLADPAAGSKPDAESFATRALAPGRNAAPDARFEARRDNKQTDVSLRADPGRDFSVLLENGSRIAMAESAPGVYAASLAGDSPTMRLVLHRPFGEAVETLYTLQNFRTILTSEDFNFARYFLNSLIVATGAAILTVLLCTMAGYAFTQKPFHFRDALFSILLGSMLVPGMIYMVPQFSLVVRFGWLNSFPGLIVPHLANVFGLFLMKQYIGQIPKDLFRAAEIDGANDMQVFRAVVIPVCLPVMVTLFLLVFVGQWSNFLWQLIVNTGDPATMTLPVGLQQFKGQNATEWELIMAGACFSILPIAVLFFAMQKYFLSGLTAGAVKE